ncbi:MAG: Spy/CpxP family protein refolding chaperone [bacterium]
MKRANRLNQGLVLVGVLVIAGWLMAEPPAQAEDLPMPAMAGWDIPNLSDVQREQILALRIKHLKEVLPMESDIRIKQLELKALWQEEKFDAKQIVAKVKEIGELQTKLELARVNHRIEIYKILTPEQKKMFRPGIGHGWNMRQRMNRRCRAMPQP